MFRRSSAYKKYGQMDRVIPFYSLDDCFARV